MYEAIKQFLKPPNEGGAYTDEKLAALLAHAEDKKLSFYSCCCLVGAATADHALRGELDEEINDWDAEDHYQKARLLDVPATRFRIAERCAFNPLSIVRHTFVRYLVEHPAEDEFYEMGETDAERRAKLIPLIHEEMERRNRMSLKTEHVESREFCSALK